MHLTESFLNLRTGLGGIVLTGTSSVSLFLVKIAPVISAIGIFAGTLLTILSLIVYIRKHFQIIKHFPFVQFRDGGKQ